MPSVPFRTPVARRWRRCAALTCAAAALLVQAPARAERARAERTQADPAPSVVVQDAWVRATLPGQKTTGAYLRLRARSATRLIAVRTPVAAATEMHAMRMEGEVMTMRLLPDGLELPAGKTVDLQAGHYHLMLMDLKKVLPAGSSIALTLVFVDAWGVQSQRELQVPARATAPPAQGR
jgi:copper(I)-binding protein